MTRRALPISRAARAPRPGIIHLGLGAFFRAHGAVIIEEAQRASAGDWGIIGVSLRSPTIRDALAPQDFCYTTIERAPERETWRQIEILSDVVFAPNDPMGLIARMADPTIKIVSLTVTEKGYCHVPGTGQLDPNHPDIQTDLASPRPKSAVGFLVRALAQRRAAGLRPFTVLSCDNLPDNGQVAQNVVLGMAQRIDPGLAGWIANEGRFPSTMVDRIVPATSQTDIKAFEENSGRRDASPVVHEPFRQWVIEDSFVDGSRPTFEGIAGVDLVGDVAPFELMKLRMLNGTHSALSYLGYLAGHDTISGVSSDPEFAKFAERLWRDEIIPTLKPPEGADLNAYAGALLQRYKNPSIQHRTWQIAMDGSQKLPQRILGTISDNIAGGRPCPGLILAVAGWMRYVKGKDEKGAPIDVRDPLAAELNAVWKTAQSPADAARGILRIKTIFEGTPRIHEAEDQIIAVLEGLVQSGARATMRMLLGE